MTIVQLKGIFLSDNFSHETGTREKQVAVVGTVEYNTSVLRNVQLLRQGRCIRRRNTNLVWGLSIRMQRVTSPSLIWRPHEFGDIGCCCCCTWNVNEWSVTYTGTSKRKMKQLPRGFAWVERGPEQKTNFYKIHHSIYHSIFQKIKNSWESASLILGLVYFLIKNSLIKLVSIFNNSSDISSQPGNESL